MKFSDAVKSKRPAVLEILRANIENMKFLETNRSFFDELKNMFTQGTFNEVEELVLKCMLGIVKDKPFLSKIEIQKVCGLSNSETSTIKDNAMGKINKSSPNLAETIENYFDINIYIKRRKKPKKGLPEKVLKMMRTNPEDTNFARNSSEETRNSLKHIFGLSEEEGGFNERERAVMMLTLGANNGRPMQIRELRIACKLNIYALGLIRSSAMKKISAQDKVQNTNLANNIKKYIDQFTGKDRGTKMLPIRITQIMRKTDPSETIFIKQMDVNNELQRKVWADSLKNILDNNVLSEKEKAFLLLRLGIDEKNPYPSRKAIAKLCGLHVNTIEKFERQTLSKIRIHDGGLADEIDWYISRTQRKLMGSGSNKVYNSPERTIELYEKHKDEAFRIGQAIALKLKHFGYCDDLIHDCLLYSARCCHDNPEKFINYFARVLSIKIDRKRVMHIKTPSLDEAVMNVFGKKAIEYKSIPETSLGSEFAQLREEVRVLTSEQMDKMLNMRFGLDGSAPMSVEQVAKKLKLDVVEVERGTNKGINILFHEWTGK